jgi:hypothetical protein
MYIQIIIVISMNIYSLTLNNIYITNIFTK